MGPKHIPILGLILAILFGPRGANLASTPGERPSSGGAVHSQPKTKKAAAKVQPPTHSADDCGENGVDLEKHWWLTKSAHGCSVALSPVWKEICKLNASHPGESALAAPDLSEPDFRKLCLGETKSIGTIMAAVPNPRHTHLGLMTDRAIEAIQVAVSEAHFLPLYHFLPWPAPNSATEKNEAAASTEAEAEPPEPGILIFRDSDKPNGKRPKYLLVFLIPEMPTEGVDREVFLRAAKMMDSAAPDTNRIRFAGPNFSGSMTGLVDLQKELQQRQQGKNASGQPKPCIRAVSGSVTNPPEDLSSSCMMFTPMETKDSKALCLFVRGAKAFGYEPEQIAILSEEGTQYGKQSPIEGQTKPSEKGTKAPVCSDDGTQLWFLHFPREISKLRNAYGAELVKPASGEASGSNGLGMQWQDSEGSQRDDMQTYGDRQTPLSQEAVLSTLSITLKAKGIKALGILATDPMDEAFLIYSIKKSSPDVRLFLRDPDLLFLRTPDVGSLNGTLLVSNYPLVPGNQFWSSTRALKEQSQTDKPVERHLITFPSAFQEGEYNAVVELLEDKDQSWAPDDHPMKRLEWDWPAGIHLEDTDYETATADSNKAVASDSSSSTKEAASASAANAGDARPLWLAVIGTAGHYPVKLLNYFETKPAKLELHSLDLGTPQFLPILLWSGISAMGLLHLLALKFNGGVPSMFKRDFDFSDRKTTVTLVKMSCHMMAILTIGLSQFILGSSYLFFYDAGLRYGLLALAVSAVTVILLVEAANLLRKIYTLSGELNPQPCKEEMPRASEPGPQPSKKASEEEEPAANKILQPAAVLWSSVAGATIMILSGALWGGMTMGNRFDNAFLHFRNLSLSSGVAPTLPLASLLLVLYFGVWGYLRRLDYWEHRYVGMFSLELDPVIRQDFSKEIKGIDACLLGRLENRAWNIAFGMVLVCSILAFRPWTALDMIERPVVARLALFFFCLALLSLWMNWFRFLNVWVRLRKILEHLENLPLRTAFQRLPREKSLPILQWNSPQNSFLLRQVLDRVRAMVKADPNKANQDLEANFEAKIDALMPKRQRLEVVASKVVGGPTLSSMPLAVSDDPVGEARLEMTSLTTTLSSRLNKEFWNRGSSGSDNEKRPKAADMKYLLAEDVVALPFYAYIRKVMQEMRNILFFLGISISLLFCALHTYAFRADQAIDWWFFGLFITMGLGVVTVVAQVERNALVSRLSDKTAGELGGSFYLQLLKYGTVPLLTIFGSQIPFISNVVLKWVQPALEALH